MQLQINNIGKVDNACIDINGITVIAGENNTGKSTISRALFSVFNSFYDVERQIRKERISSINNISELWFRRPNLSFQTIDILSNTTNSIIENLDKYLDGTIDLEDIDNRIKNALEENGIDTFDKEEVFVLIKRIKDSILVPKEELLKLIVTKKLNMEFNGQIDNIYSEDEGNIHLRIKDSDLIVSLVDNVVKEISNKNNLSLHLEAIYIDDPFVIDSTRPLFYRRGFYPLGHREDLYYKILRNTENNNLVDELITTNKLANIYDKISSICDGDVYNENNSKLLVYKSKGSDKTLDVRNLSTGLKTFVILKTLLLNGSIEANGMIILDEPEIHLHPEWQLIFAEIIVLIQKEFGVHILLNTHSPYFLNAIEVYAEKYGIAKNCKYYLAETEGRFSHFKDVTDNVDEIYIKLSKPLQTLENQRYSND